MSQSADFDNDGDLDVSWGSNNPWYRNNDNATTFSVMPALFNSFGRVGACVAVGALVTNNVTDVVGCLQNRVAWFGNFGNSTFSTMHALALVDTASVTVADLDKDGRQDVLAGYSNNGIVNPNLLVWFRNYGAGNFSTANTIGNTGQTIHAIRTVDVDHDGDLDVVVAYDSDSTTWFRNEGDRPGMNIL